MNNACIWPHGQFTPTLQLQAWSWQFSQTKEHEQNEDAVYDFRMDNKQSLSRCLACATNPSDMSFSKQGKGPGNKFKRGITPKNLITRVEGTGCPTTPIMTANCFLCVFFTTLFSGTLNLPNNPKPISMRHVHKSVNKKQNTALEVEITPTQLCTLFSRTDRNWSIDRKIWCLHVTQCLGVPTENKSQSVGQGHRWRAVRRPTDLGRAMPMIENVFIKLWSWAGSVSSANGMDPG